MRALTMDELEFVSGGWQAPPPPVVVRAFRVGRRVDLVGGDGDHQNTLTGDEGDGSGGSGGAYTCTDLDNARDAYDRAVEGGLVVATGAGVVAGAAFGFGALPVAATATIVAAAGSAFAGTSYIMSVVVGNQMRIFGCNA